MPAFEQCLRVYYRDTDSTGIVYHANYLSFAERGRVDALHSVDASASSLERAHGLVFLVRSAQLEYVRPLRIDDAFTLRTGTRTLSGASAVIRHRFMLDGVVTTNVSVSLICVRTEDWRPARIPAKWRDALRALHDEGED